MRAGWTILAVLAIATPLLAQAEDERFAAGSEKAAAEALTRFGQLVTAENYSQMGFESPEEVRTAKLGPPMRQYSVGLDDLRRYTPGADPSPLLRGSDTLVFPVLVGAEERSSIVLERRGEGWRAVSFGAPGLTRSVAEARGPLGAPGAGASISLVRVPALNLFFIGTRRDGELMLAPVLDDPRLKMQKGVALPAKEVFAALVPLAREHNDLPT